MEEWILINKEDDSWISLIFLLNFLLFVVAKTRYNPQFKSFFRYFDTPLYFSNYSDNLIVTGGFNSIMGLFTFSNICLFLSFSLKYFADTPLRFEIFLVLFVAIFSIVLLRGLFIQLVGNFTGVISIINQYQFRILTYLKRWAIFIFIGLVFYHYALDDASTYFKSFFALAITVYIIYQIMVVIQLFKYINPNGLYFILYICTFKITPWIFLIKRLNQLEFLIL